MWTIFKIFIEFVTILLLFYLFFFNLKACGILVPCPRIDPISPALEGGFLTTGPPGRSLEFLFFKNTETGLHDLRFIKVIQNGTVVDVQLSEHQSPITTGISSLLQDTLTLFLYLLHKAFA